MFLDSCLITEECAGWVSVKPDGASELTAHWTDSLLPVHVANIRLYHPSVLDAIWPTYSALCHDGRVLGASRLVHFYT